MSDTSAPTPRSGRPASFWIAILLVFLLGFSLLMNLGLMAVAGAAAGGAALDGKTNPYGEKFIEGSGEQRIVIIDVRGEISDRGKDTFLGEGPSLVERTTAQLRQAREDDAVAAVILAVDSPGGGVTSSDVLHQEVLKTKNAGKKVVVHMGDLCASGGYYISASADRIIASPTSITGSIGVIMHMADMHRLIEDKLGITMTPIKSGQYKDIASPMRPMSEEERKLLQQMVDDMYARFVGIVAEGRMGHGPFTGDIAAVTQAVRVLADGRIYTGDQAVENGLADAVGYLADAIASAKDLAGLREATVIKYRKEEGLLGLLGASAKGVNVNAGVQIDASSMLDRLTPKLEYKWCPGE